MTMLRRLAARLPDRWQIELKRIHHERQIRKGTFLTSEPEYKLLRQFINPGDWVIDIGANVGYYTKLFSELVGAHGRVIAFEPVPATFSLLAANIQLFANTNVTLINAAASDRLGVVGMTIPRFSTGLQNYSEAHVSVTDSALSILTLQLDFFFNNQRISLVKIDTEGHEASVLKGMQNLIKKHYPILIIETSSQEIVNELSLLGYVSERLPDSPNIIFKFKKSGDK